MERPEGGDTISEDDDSKSGFSDISDDLNLGDLAEHKSPTIVSLAVEWKKEVPENTQFLSAITSCLNWQLWENEQGQPLDGEVLRTKFYDEVVKRLEVELRQAFSKTPIDELDEKAAELDFGNWDQTISSGTRQTQGSVSNWVVTRRRVYREFIPKDLSSSRSGPVRVAILDTGIDKNHRDVEAREDNIKGKYNWLDQNRVRSVVDRKGHGTFAACLLLDYAPDVELYVAKIAENEPTSPRMVARAIDHAVSQWGVDIISMSFGYPDKKGEGYKELEKALDRACYKHVLLFAAASNGGGKVQPSFPAREDTVIAVYSTDTDGDRSNFSPTAMKHELNLATVGEAVESAWLDDQVKSKSGTSYATPIMAGIAAFLLQYARIHIPGKAAALKKRKGMMEVLKRIAEKGPRYQQRDGYYFVDLSLWPDGLFGKDEPFIDMIIGDVLDSI
ncbi:pfs domain-containing protein [Colletotrichum plurivorum]|uniref:Pfs domain-containing protein n=1 Tax=Colletotrichum plurivorum TaxID=2175906 RepID=A0A8H6N7J6_9PEZI|nr:pfs domain-containing protein [Colletotrichum plurivorum]